MAAAATPSCFTATGSPCQKQTDLQLANTLGNVPGIQTCTDDARTTEAGPGAVTYTTPVLTHDLDLAGPMNARVYLTSTRPEALLYLALEDVGPDGRADVVTYGQQVASMRAFDRSRSWHWDRQLIAPYHYFTQRTARPLVNGRIVAMDVDLYGTLTRIAKGHRLRLLVASRCGVC